MIVTISDLVKEYHSCGGYLRRNDASVKKPSPLFSINDVLNIAVEEINMVNRLSALVPPNVNDHRTCDVFIFAGWRRSNK